MAAAPISPLVLVLLGDQLTEHHLAGLCSLKLVTPCAFSDASHSPAFILLSFKRPRSLLILSLAPSITTHNSLTSQTFPSSFEQRSRRSRHALAGPILSLALLQETWPAEPKSPASTARRCPQLAEHASGPASLTACWQLCTTPVARISISPIPTGRLQKTIDTPLLQVVSSGALYTCRSPGQLKKSSSCRQGGCVRCGMGIRCVPDFTWWGIWGRDLWASRQAPAPVVWPPRGASPSSAWGLSSMVLRERKRTLVQLQLTLSLGHPSCSMTLSTSEEILRHQGPTCMTALTNALCLRDTESQHTASRYRRLCSPDNGFEAIEPISIVRHCMCIVRRSDMLEEI